MSAPQNRDLADVEAYFLHSGLPHLASGYDARADTLTRLRVPFLVIAVAGIAFVLRGDTPLWARFLVALAAVVAILAVLAVINVLRGRPALRRPERVGFIEASLLIAAPAAADLAVGDSIGRTLQVLVGTVAVAAVFYALTSLGVVAMFWHLGRRALEGLADTATVALRAMPPMLAVLLFLFLATEVWQAFGLTEGWRFGGIMTLFAVLGIGAVLATLRRERASFLHPDSSDADLARRAEGTPAGRLVRAGVHPAAPPLTRMQRVNVTVALLFSLGARIVAVGVAIAVFFLVFGILAVDRTLTAGWTGVPDPNILLSVSIRGREVVLSEALVRVSALLGAFAALYFAVVALSEQRNREDFLEDEIARISSVMAAWAYYQGALADGHAPGSAGAGAGG